MSKYSSLPTDELLCLCSTTGDYEAWEEFVRRFHRLIAAVVLRTARRWGESSMQSIDDLVQETYLKLCADNFRVLREFRPRQLGSSIGYVKVVTANLVHDHFKSAHSRSRGANRTVQMIEDCRFALQEGVDGSAQSIERSVLIDELERWLETGISGQDKERNKRIFRLHFRVGLSAPAISALPGIGLSTKGVESLLFRLINGLRSQIVSEQNRTNLEGTKPKESFLELGEDVG
jgi:RNA polymerase sigma factor (sigma-70 family)